MTAARPGESRAAAARVLLVDIGNTRIKWAWWRAGRIGAVRAAVQGAASAQTLARGLSAQRRPRIARVVVASVAGARADRRFAAAVRRAAGIEPEFLVSARRVAGVTTRYRDPWRLGVDRFAAAIGAHQLAGRRGACVVSVGTTMTIDFVDGRGVHRGGVIVPSPELMVWSLKARTAGIAPRAGRRVARVPRAGTPFARSTEEAIWQGALHAVAAAVDRAASEARARLGSAALVLITGGAAPHIEPLLRARHVVVPELVLRGLAVHAGLAVR